MKYQVIRFLVKSGLNLASYMMTMISVSLDQRLHVACFPDSWWLHVLTLSSQGV